MLQILDPAILSVNSPTAAQDCGTWNRPDREAVCCSAPTGRWQKGDSLSAHFPLAALLRQNCSRQGQSPACTHRPIWLRGSLQFCGWKCHRDRQQVPTEPQSKERDKAWGGTGKGIHVEPLTTYLQQAPCTRRYDFSLLIHCLHGFTGGFIPTGIFHCSHI